jgi:hypothetical protein
VLGFFKSAVGESDAGLWVKAPVRLIVKPRVVLKFGLQVFFIATSLADSFITGASAVAH